MLPLPFQGMWLKDDYPLLVDALRTADAVIVAAPTYFLGANGLLKMVLDRGIGLHHHIDGLWGKPSVGVAIAGIIGKEGQALLDVQRFLKLTLTDMKKSVVVYGALPGEVFMNAENEAVARELGRALFSATSPKDGPHCPLCGGDTFRFIDETQVRCMLCSNSGRMRMEGGKIQFMIEKSDHDLFLTKANVLDHSAWLKGMKDKFRQHKDALSSIAATYQHEGAWIKPPKKRRSENAREEE
ncbi:flavodoxin family protein [Desulfosarcina cetonica]|uniref:flavodoxin family protein n=1 Tax=Desulfosarcina cetonica TaxID=90730 RepID=UPI0009F92CCD|nr:NAD(P)H-dependent oxidoreductase [Desulfosarcina cetonica]